MTAVATLADPHEGQLEQLALAAHADQTIAPPDHVIPIDRSAVCRGVSQQREIVQHRWQRDGKPSSVRQHPFDMLVDQTLATNYATQLAER